jgi:hypothetical protein
MSFEMQYDRDGHPVIPKHSIPVMPNPIQPEKLPELPVEPEITPDETQEEVSEEPIAEAAPIEQQTVREKPETLQQKNFKTLREAKETVERERDEAVRLVKDLQERFKQSQSPSYPSHEEDDININPEDIVEGKHLKPHVKKVNNEIRQLREELRAYKQQSEEAILEARLKSEHPDFFNVVTKDNIEHLRLAKPHLAQVLQSTQDPYLRYASAYTLIKDLNLHQEDTFQEERIKAKYNASRPRSVASVTAQGGDALTKANAFAGGLTDELRAHLVKEMRTAQKNM